MKQNESFYRYRLIELGEKAAGHPILFTGRYQHSDHSKWIILNAIRLLLDSSKTICSHINLSRETAANQIALTPSLHQHKVIFLGEIESYSHFGTLRGGIKLVKHETINCIWPASSAEADLLKIKELKKSITIYG